MRNFFFNFLAALTMRLQVPRYFHRLPLLNLISGRIRVPYYIQDWVANGCERYTPPNHRWRDEPMF